MAVRFNFVTFIPGATYRKSTEIDGMYDVTLDGRTRQFSEQLLHQLPNKDVVQFIKAQFGVTPPN